MDVETVCCDLCGADEAEELFVGRDRVFGIDGLYPVVRCKNCQLVYLNPRPSKKSISKYYPDNYEPYSRGSGIVGVVKLMLRRSLARKIFKIAGRDASVLEIGSASGALLRQLHLMGCNVTGVEINKNAVKATQDAGFDVRLGTLEDVDFYGKQFDLIVMRHVIEHVRSPLSTLKKAHSLLRDGGKIFLTTPNIDSVDCRTFGEYWHAYDPPRHLTLFTPKTLKQMLGKAGFVVNSVSYSTMPNNFVCSLNNLLVHKYNVKFLRHFFSLKNPFCLALFYPISLFFSCLKVGGIVDVVAVKKNEK